MSTGFSFGAKTTAAPTFGTGNLSFGSPAMQPQQQSLQFGFGNTASATPSLFGTPAPATTAALGFKPSGFGGAAAAPTGANFSLGAPGTGFGAAAPAANTGFSFGAPTTSTGALSFGNPASGVQSSGLSFGTPSANTGLSFGAAAGAPTSTGGLTFATSSAAPSFGLGNTLTGTVATATPATGLSFGTSTATPGVGGLSFGTSTATPASGLSFGTATPAPGLNFNTSTVSTGLTFGTSTPSTGLNFSATTTSAAAPSGLSFGTATPATGLSFGAATSAPTGGLNFGTASTAAPSLSFGGLTATTSAAGGGLSFGTSTSGLNFGLGGATSTSTAITTNPLGLTASTQANVGLGGIASTQVKTGAAAATQKEVPPKEQLLPNELLQLVEQFKVIVQEEKIRSSDVARCSIKEFRKVETDLDLMSHQFSQVENQLQNNRAMAEQLKIDTAKGLQNIEMAQRTQDTPPSLQYDNTAPLKFFLDLADCFEREMQSLKVKIDNTEKFIKKSDESNVLTSQDLTQGLKRLHETFVALSGRMQAIHNQVETQKEIFLSLRRQAVKDNVNPFERSDKSNEVMSSVMRTMLKSPPNLASGPTPFNSIALGSNNLAFAAQQTPPPNYPTATTTTGLGFGLGSASSTGFGLQPSNTSMFKTGFGSSNSQPFQMNSNFQLQKPPSGNKRGKQ